VVKKIVFKILSIFLAFLVLFSSFSFTVYEHYCGGDLVDSSVFLKAKSCTLEMEKYSPNEDCTNQNDKCCSDLVIQIEGQDELKSLTTNLNFYQQVFNSSFYHSSSSLFEGIISDNIPFKNYSPPVVNNDFMVLFQTFLI
jgi:hypothetical protein